MLYSSDVSHKLILQNLRGLIFLLASLRMKFEENDSNYQYHFLPKSFPNLSINALCFVKELLLLPMLMEVALITIFHSKS